MLGFFTSGVLGNGYVELGECAISNTGGLRLVDKNTGGIASTSSIVSCSQIDNDDICFQTHSGSRYIIRFETLADLRGSLAQSLKKNAGVAPFNSLKYTELGRMMGL